MSIGFDRGRDRRRDELSNNKTVKAVYHLRLRLEDVFRFAECQEKATYGLGYKLSLTRNKDEAVINKTAIVPDVRKIIDHIHWYIPNYQPSIQQQGVLSNQVLNKTPTEIRYIERCVFPNEVNHCNFELGSQEHMKVPRWIIIGFQQRIGKIHKF